MRQVGVATQEDVDALRSGSATSSAHGMTARPARRRSAKTTARSRRRRRPPRASQPRRSRPPRTTEHVRGVTRRRLDAELVRRGLAASRAEAHEAVQAGIVLVAGIAGDASPPRWSPTMPRSPLSGGRAVRVARPAQAGRGARPVRRRSVGRDVPRRGRVHRRVHRLPAPAGARPASLAVDVGLRPAGLGAADRPPRRRCCERTNVRDLMPEDLPLSPSSWWRTSRSSRCGSCCRRCAARRADGGLRRAREAAVRGGQGRRGQGRRRARSGGLAARARGRRRGGGRRSGWRLARRWPRRCAGPPATWSSCCTCAAGGRRSARTSDGARGRGGDALMSRVGFVVHEGRPAAVEAAATLAGVPWRPTGSRASDLSRRRRRSTSWSRSAATARSCARPSLRPRVGAPVLGVKVGRLGFLTEVEPAEAEALVRGRPGGRGADRGAARRGRRAARRAPPSRPSGR